MKRLSRKANLQDIIYGRYEKHVAEAGVDELRALALNLVKRLAYKMTYGDLQDWNRGFAAVALAK